MTTIDLKQDLHTHSTFSDGAHSIQDNILAAERLGLHTLAMTDHVRRQTTWLPDYVEAIEKARTGTHVELLCGVEAKLIDEYGSLDLPARLDGVQLVQIADHSFPLGNCFYTPEAIRVLYNDGLLTKRRIIDALIDSTVLAMRHHSDQGYQLVLAHLFSILPKLGFREDQVLSRSDIMRVALTALETDTYVEISERWRCPNLRTLRIMKACGVKLVASSDAHRAEYIGQFSYVARMSRELDSEEVCQGRSPSSKSAPNFIMLEP